VAVQRREHPQSAEKVPPKNAPQTARAGVVTHLEAPRPLIGRHGQHLGKVTALYLSAEGLRVEQIELRTPWQTLLLSRDAVSYDQENESFRLRRRARARVTDR
jgi:hypothetical protein